MTDGETWVLGLDICGSVGFHGRLLESPADDAFDLGVLLNLLLLETALAVLQAVLVLLQDLVGLLLLRHEPLLVLLQLAMGQLEPLLQGVDLLFVLFDLEFKWEEC